MKKYLIPSISLLFILVLNTYFASFPAYFPQLKKAAAERVEWEVSREAKRDIDRRFPSFSEYAKDNLIEARISDYKKSNPAFIKKRVLKQYEKLKAPYQDKTGQTYLMELDCWHWARYTENVVRLGHPGDELRNGCQFDALMAAPTGSRLVWYQLLFYLSAFLYKAFSLFKTVPLNTFLFYLPLFFSSLFLSVLFFFCLRHKDNLCAVVACLFVELSPVFLYRSSAGWFDNDMLNLLFPLLISWAYIEGSNAASLARRFLWVSFSAFLVGLFCATWGYWWSIFLVVIIYEFYSLLILFSDLLQFRQWDAASFKRHLSCFVMFTTFGLSWCLLICGTRPFQAWFFQIDGALNLARSLNRSIWPNVHVTVAELKSWNFNSVAYLLGGTVLLVISWVSLAVVYLLNRKFSPRQQEAILLLTVWFLVMLFAAFNGIRFCLFLALPLGIALGWAVSELYAFIKNKGRGLAAAAGILMLVLTARLVSNAYSAAGGIYPLMNDSWYKLLTALREKTPSEAIINTWWDFGNWISAVSLRRVTADGQSAAMPQVYWLARVLFNSGEEEAVNILRMLNNGGNEAFEVLDREFHDSYRSVLFLEKLLAADKPKREDLFRLLPQPVAEKLRPFFDKKPAPAYFIVDYTMLTKVRPISYLGNWDFIRVFLFHNSARPRTETLSRLSGFGIEKKEAERLIKEASLVTSLDSDNYVSKRLKFYGNLTKGQQRDDTVLFNKGLVYFPSADDLALYSCSRESFRIPRSFFTMENGVLVEKKLKGGNLDLSCLIMKPDRDYQSILLDPELAETLFSRLYFMRGKGLKHFRIFLEEKKDEKDIRVFEIIWE